MTDDKTPTSAESEPASEAVGAESPTAPLPEAADVPPPAASAQHASFGAPTSAAPYGYAPNGVPLVPAGTAVAAQPFLQRTWVRVVGALLIALLLLGAGVGIGRATDRGGFEPGRGDHSRMSERGDGGFSRDGGTRGRGDEGARGTWPGRGGGADEENPRTPEATPTPGATETPEPTPTP